MAEISSAKSDEMDVKMIMPGKPMIKPSMNLEILSDEGD